MRMEAVRTVKTGKKLHMQYDKMNIRLVVYMSSTMESAQIEQEYCAKQDPESEFSVCDAGFNVNLLRQGSMWRSFLGGLLAGCQWVKDEVANKRESKEYCSSDR